MKFTPVLAAVLLASPALADDHGEKAAEVTDEAKAAKFTTDMPIEKLMADEKAKAVLVKNFGGQDLSAHPMYPQMKAMSLKAIAPFSQGMITDEMLAKIDADLAEIK